MYILVGLIIIIFGCFSYCFFKYVAAKDMLMNIEFAQKSISTHLARETNILNRASKILEEKGIDFKVESKINLNNDYDIELEKSIRIVYDEFENVLMSNSELLDDSKVFGIKRDLKDVNNDIMGLKEYHNYMAKDFNSLFENSFYKILFKIVKFKKADLYETKKIADLEILKN